MQDTENKPWWKPAVMMFTQISAWVIIPVIGALFIGKYFDKQYGTAPLLFIILTGIAFLISLFGIWKILKKYLRNLEKEIQDKNGKSD
jgi:F0F1-type ATP synthase assembly protein I